MIFVESVWGYSQKETVDDMKSVKRLKWSLKFVCPIRLSHSAITEEFDVRHSIAEDAIIVTNKALLGTGDQYEKKQTTGNSIKNELKIHDWRV